MNIYPISFERLSQNGKRFPLLFVDYASQNERSEKLTEHFFNGDFRKSFVVQEKLTRLEHTNYPREELATLLAEQQTRYAPSPKTLENIERLRNPKTVAILTGQQVGLFSGSLYTIYKTASAIALAKKYKQEFPDYDFVPIFWLEGEDHDYDEVSSVTLLVGNETKTLRYDEKNYAERKMVGRTRFSEGIEPFVSEVLSLLPTSDFKEELSNLIQSSYKQGETLLTAFAKFMGALFKEDGLVFLSPDDAKFKSLVREVFIKEFETFPKNSEEVIAQSARLEDEGYEAQAKVKPINFYWIDEQGKRWNLEASGEKYFKLKPSREEVLKTALLETVYNAPEKLSPNVVLRPIVQDKALPTLAYVAGPSEVAYWAQLKRAYQFFNVEMPLVVPRASLTVVEPKISKVFEKLGGEFREARYEQFFSEKESLLKEYIATHSEINLDGVFENIEAEVKATMQTLEASLKLLDPSLLQTLETAQGKMLFQVSQLKEKAFRSQKQKQNEFLSQIEKCDVNLLPSGKLQERALNVLYFLNKYGLSFIRTVQDAVEASDWTKHTVVEL
ncbi:MAG: bacillithiol biosynthesis cysteine-adding enzyme BshC [Chloroherpetonaceae bacterium]